MRPLLRAIRLPQDPEGYVRRECPSCHRIWKTAPWRSDPEAVQRFVARHLPHENPDELQHGQTAAFGACPYCGERACADSFFTAEQRAWLEHLAQAYGNLIRHELLMQVQRTLSQNPYPTFVPVKPEAAPAPLTDARMELRPAHFVCCGTEARVERFWRKALFCPRCGARHQGAAPKPLPVLPQALA